MYQLKFFLNKQVRDFKIMEFRTFFISKVNTFFYLIMIFPFYITAFIFCLLMRILSIFLIIRIGKISAVNFGNLAEDPARYICKKKLNLEINDKKKVDLFYFFRGKFYSKYSTNQNVEKRVKCSSKIFLTPNLCD